MKTRNKLLGKKTRSFPDVRAIKPSHSLPTKATGLYFNRSLASNIAQFSRLTVPQIMPQSHPTPSPILYNPRLFDFYLQSRDPPPHHPTDTIPSLTPTNHQNYSLPLQQQKLKVWKGRSRDIKRGREGKANWNITYSSP